MDSVRRWVRLDGISERVVMELPSSCRNKPCSPVHSFGQLVAEAFEWSEPIEGLKTSTDEVVALQLRV